MKNNSQIQAGANIKTGRGWKIAAIIAVALLAATVSLGAVVMANQKNHYQENIVELNEVISAWQTYHQQLRNGTAEVTDCPANFMRLGDGADGTCLGEMEMIGEKPIIYLYPTEPTEVLVRLSHPELLTAQYPKYNDGWKVMAQPNGDLREISSGRELYSLYYENRNIAPARVESDGFVVRGASTTEFLEEILPKLGLNARESEEFIIYWLPRLQENNYNYIRFETAAEIDVNQALFVSPKPDSVIRVMMSFKALDRPIAVQPQEVATPERRGFVVVEWGGTEILDN